MNATIAENGPGLSGRFWRFAHPPAEDRGQCQEFRRKGSQQQEEGGEESEPGFGRHLNPTHHQDQGGQREHQKDAVDPERQSTEPLQTGTANETGEDEGKVRNQQQAVWNDDYLFPAIHFTHDHGTEDMVGCQPSLIGDRKLELGDLKRLAVCGRRGCVLLAIGRDDHRRTVCEAWHCATVREY